MHSQTNWQIKINFKKRLRGEDIWFDKDLCSCIPSSVRLVTNHHNLGKHTLFPNMHPTPWVNCKIVTDPSGVQNTAECFCSLYAWSHPASCFCSITKLCLTLWAPMDCSAPGFPVLVEQTASQGLLKFMSLELVMPSNHLILCQFLLLLPLVFSSIRGFSNELALSMRWPKYWSFRFSISPSNEYSELISFRIDCNLISFVSQGLSRVLHPASKLPNNKLIHWLDGAACLIFHLEKPSQLSGHLSSPLSSNTTSLCPLGGILWR